MSKHSNILYIALITSNEPQSKYNKLPRALHKCVCRIKHTHKCELYDSIDSRAFKGNTFEWNFEFLYSASD